MAGLAKKPPMFASPEAASLMDRLSKAALLDMCWTLAMLGTDESPEQILAKVCREAEIVTREPPPPSPISSAPSDTMTHGP
jgi:hypothetical protein